MSRASLQAYETVKPNIEAQRVQIARFIKENDKCTIDQIAAYLGIEKHRFSGRLTLLQEEGIIYISGELDTGVGKALSVFSYESCPLRQKELAAEYENKIFRKDVKRFIAKWWNRLPYSTRVWCKNVLGVKAEFEQAELF